MSEHQQSPQPTESEILQEKLQQAEQQAEEYLQSWKRAQADFVNARRRDQEESERTVERKTNEVLVSLLPVLDSFKRALDLAPSEGGEWLQGIRSVHQLFLSFLKNQKVEEYGMAGDTFDPTLHEALSLEMTEEKEKDGVISEVFETGYKRESKVLRPAKVKVFSAN